MSSHHRALRRIFHVDDQMDRMFEILVTGFAVWMAWVCNRRSKSNSLWVSVTIAALFPEFYVLQASARNLVGDSYTCRKR